MDMQTVEKVMTLYRTAMAKAAAWTAAPAAELPFPPDTIKEAVKGWAEDLNRKGDLDAEAVGVLSLCYRSLARFLPNDEAEWAVPAFRKYRHLHGEEIGKDPAAGEELPKLEAISNRIVTDAKALEREFLAFLEEVNPQAVASARRQQRRIVS